MLVADEQEDNAEDDVPAKEQTSTHEEIDRQKDRQEKAAAPAPAPAPTEPRQLSKKEQKKKEMEELESVLGELGIAVDETNSTNMDDRSGAASTAAVGESDSPNVSESKTAAKKRRKAEREAAALATHQQPEASVNSEGENSGEGVKSELIDPVEAKRRLAAAKKKKSSSSSSVAKAKAEAKVRAAKKVKDKTNYNQMC